MIGASIADKGGDGMKNSILGLLCATVIAFAAGPLHAQDAAVPLGDDFVGVGYSIDRGSEIIVYAGLRNVGGQVGVCGIVLYEGVRDRLERQVTRKIKFTVAGQRLRVNTDRFTRYGSLAEAESGSARCSVTNTAWQEGFAGQSLEMDLTAGSVRDRRG
jgi:hypothetical protein